MNLSVDQGRGDGPKACMSRVSETARAKPGAGSVSLNFLPPNIIPPRKMVVVDIPI